VAARPGKTSGTRTRGGDRMTDELKEQMDWEHAEAVEGKPHGVVISIRLDPTEAERLRTLASDLHLNMSQVVRRALATFDETAGRSLSPGCTATRSRCGSGSRCTGEKLSLMAQCRNTHPVYGQCQLLYGHMEKHGKNVDNAHGALFPGWLEWFDTDGYEPSETDATPPHQERPLSQEPDHPDPT